MTTLKGSFIPLQLCFWFLSGQTLLLSNIFVSSCLVREHDFSLRMTMTAAERLQRELTKWGFKKSSFTSSYPFILPSWDAVMIAGTLLSIGNMEDGCPVFGREKHKVKRSLCYHWVHGDGILAMHSYCRSLRDLYVRRKYTSFLSKPLWSSHQYLNSYAPSQRCSKV